jgi:hypothetical protein
MALADRTDRPRANTQGKEAMSKASRRRRARERIDVRLWEGRAKKHDLLLWQFAYWNKERLQQLDRWEKSHANMYRTEDQQDHFHYFKTQLIHKGRKP